MRTSATVRLIEGVRLIQITVTVLIFGPKIFLVSSGIRQVLVKLYGKKKIRLSVHSNGISTACKTEMVFFFTTQKKSLCRVYVTQSSLERPFHVARDMSREREFSLHVSVSLWE